MHNIRDNHRRIIKRAIPANVLPTASPTYADTPVESQGAQPAQEAQAANTPVEASPAASPEPSPAVSPSPENNSPQNTPPASNSADNTPSSSPTPSSSTPSSSSSQSTSPSSQDSSPSVSSDSNTDDPVSSSEKAPNNSISSSPEHANASSSNGISGGGIAGICVGIAALLAILALILLVMMKRRKRQTKTQQRGSRMQFMGNRAAVAQSNASFGGGPFVNDENVAQPIPQVPVGAAPGTAGDIPERSSTFIPMPIAITQGQEATATTQFVPSLPDEVMLSPGDKVKIIKEWDDGWCSIQHLSNGVEGVCPKEVLGVLSQADDFADTLSEFNKRESLYNPNTDKRRSSSLVNSQQKQQLGELL